MDDNDDDFILNEHVRLQYLLILKRNPTNVEVKYYVKKIKNKQINLEHLLIHLKSCIIFIQLLKMLVI